MLCMPVLVGLQIVVGAGQSYSSHAPTSSDAFLEVRSPGAFIAGSTTRTVEGRFRFIFVGPIRTGLGFQFTQLPTEQSFLPTDAYVRVRSTRQGAYGLGVADIGIGRYDRSYARALIVSGAAHRPTDVDFLLFDQPTQIDYQGLNHGTARFSGAGIEGRLLVIYHLALSGSALIFSGSDPRIPPNTIHLHVGFSF